MTFDEEAPANWRQRIEDKVNVIQINVAKLTEGQITDAELNARINTRVSLDAYNGDIRGVNERLTRIENGPQRIIAWTGVITGCLGVFISFLSVVVGIVIWLIANTHK